MREATDDKDLDKCTRKKTQVEKVKNAEEKINKSVEKVSNAKTDTANNKTESDFERNTIVEGINNLKKDLEKIKALKVEDSELQKVKDNVIKGTECFINGFTQYFNYDMEANTTLKAADEYFYKAQEQLDGFLETLKE